MTVALSPLSSHSSGLWLHQATVSKEGFNPSACRNADVTGVLLPVAPLSRWLKRRLHQADSGHPTYFGVCLLLRAEPPFLPDA